MGKAIRRFGVAVVLGITPAVPSAAEQTPSPPLVLTVHVDNHANISAGVLAGARDEASRVYRAIGVTIRWTEGANAATDASPAVRVLLLSRVMANRKIAAEGLPDSVLGQALREVGWTYIYWDRVKAHASKYARNPIEILAIVVAHEIGHLLLPDNGHSPLGIMQAAFDARTAIAPRFTADQAKIIRGVLGGDEP